MGYPGPPYYPPAYDDPDEMWMFQAHCSRCGSWLKLRPERSEDGEVTEHCPGKPTDGLDWTVCGAIRQHEPHEAVMHAWTTNFHTCTRCGHVNEVIDA